MYVALSRLKCFKDFLIQPFTLERLQKLSKSTSLKPRQNEELRIKNIIKKTLDDHFQRLMNYKNNSYNCTNFLYERIL